jgi:membrane fusion protein (multidrug efflux system)
MKILRRRDNLDVALVSGVLLLAACSHPPPPPPPPPLEVGVLTLATTALPLTEELPGRVSAFFVAQVDARVSGIVEKRLFREGAMVKQGELLYQIAPEPYEAALQLAQGTLASAQANLTATRAQADRYARLVDSGAVNRQDYDNAVASYHAYQGQVISDQGSVQTAKINLGYTRVTSPISGRIGISQVTEGAYVQDGAATWLATVQQLDRVYVDVVQSSLALIRLKRDLASGKLKSDASGAIHVKLLEEDGRQYPEDGTLQLADVSVSTSTSTVLIRLVFPNPRQDLLPGMFVRAVLDQGVKPDAILVPQLAVTHNVKGEPTALVVAPEGKVQLRTLRTSRAIGNQWLVDDGLEAGDRLVVEDLQKVHPGMPVTPVPARLAASYLPPEGGRE